MVDAALIDLEVERLMTVGFIRSHPTTAAFLRGGSARRDAVSMDFSNTISVGPVNYSAA